MSNRAKDAACQGLMVDINPQGRLVEKGFDPFMEVADTAAQTVALPQERGSVVGVGCGIGLGKDKGVPVDAARVLKYAVGLLGLEVHERPDNWAEVWCTFQDAAGANCGLGGGSTGTRPSRDNSYIRPGDVYKSSHKKWQNDVLSHLRNLIEQSKEQPIASGGHDWGPDFGEHLDLAQFILGRIAHNVGTLGDPEKKERPLVLREYTEAQVQKVCTDLKQWLEQLATLISLYHVHLLDLESEKGRLSLQLQKEKNRADDADDKARQAQNRFEGLQEHWEEDKMKRKAQEMLGREAMGGINAAIYSQADLDRFMQQWERENLPPLREEIKELKKKIEELNGKLKANNKELMQLRKAQEQASAEAAGMTGESTGVLVTALMALGDKTKEDAVSRMLSRLAEACKLGESQLNDVLQAIRQMPDPTPGDSRPGSGKSSEWNDSRHGSKDMRSNRRKSLLQAAECLEAVKSEMSDLAKKAKRGSLQNLAQWAEKTVKGAQEAVEKDVPVNYAPPPAWDLDGKVETKSMGVQTLSKKKPGAADSDDEDGPGGSRRRNGGRAPEDEIAGLQAELERARNAAQEKYEAERQKMTEAIDQLEQDLQAAKRKIRELTERILELERLLKAKGLGKELKDAMEKSGLAAYLANCRDVYERLYRDAIDRMRRFAEAQARRFEENQFEYMRTIDAIYNPYAKQVVAAHQEESWYYGGIHGIVGARHPAAPSRPAPSHNPAAESFPQEEYYDAATMAEQIMAAADKLAKNSQLALVELQAFLGVGTSGHTRFGPFLNWMMSNSGGHFRRFDLNTDGVISISELREAVAAFISDTASTACSTARLAEKSSAGNSPSHGPCLLITPLRRDSSPDPAGGACGQAVGLPSPPRPAGLPSPPGVGRGGSAGGPRVEAAPDYFSGAIHGHGAGSAPGAQKRGRAATQASSGGALPPLNARGSPGGGSQKRPTSSSPPRVGLRSFGAASPMSPPSSEYALRIERLGPPLDPPPNGERPNVASHSGFGKSAAIGYRMQRPVGMASMPQLGKTPPAVLLQGVSMR